MKKNGKKKVKWQYKNGKNGYRIGKRRRTGRKARLTKQYTGATA